MKLQHPPNGHRLKEELARAVARAEAAEKRVAVAEEAASALSGVIVSIAEALGIKDSEPYLSRKTLAAVKAQVERVQELEAQLAAQAWRPVTEPPPGSEPSDGSSLWLVCWDYDPEAGCRLARYAPFIRMWFMEGDEFQPIDPTHYKANDLPAPPKAHPG